MARTWTFLRVSGLWDCSSNPAIDDNLARAIETLADSFGTQAWRVQLFLDYWEGVSGSDGLQEPVNTTTACLRPVDARVVRICDKYGQFADVEAEAADLKSALRELMAEMRKEFEQY